MTWTWDRKPDGLVLRSTSEPGSGQALVTMYRYADHAPPWRGLTRSGKRLEASDELQAQHLMLEHAQTELAGLQRRIRLAGLIGPVLGPRCGVFDTRMDRITLQADDLVTLLWAVRRGDDCALIELLDRACEVIR